MPISPIAASAETSPIESSGQQIQPNPPHQVATDRRASNQSLDGILIRPEDYSQDSGIASGATGMVRGIVEAGLSRVSLILLVGHILIYYLLQLNTLTNLRPMSYFCARR